MSLLKWLSNISPFRGMPTDNKKTSASPYSVSGKTVQIKYNNSGSLADDAGQAAGVVVMMKLPHDNICNLLGDSLGKYGDSSLTFTSTALTTEVGPSVINHSFIENLDEATWSARMTAIGAKLANGEYFVDYAKGVIYAKKASTQTTLTAVAYKVPSTDTFSVPATGELAGATSATQMPNIVCKMVKFKAHADNAGKVYIGGSGVTKVDGTTDTTSGFQLSAGEETGWLLVENLNIFYRICDNTGDDLTYLSLS